VPETSAGLVECALQPVGKLCRQRGICYQHRTAGRAAALPGLDRAASDSAQGIGGGLAVQFALAARNSDAD
jgi:hypothetical protein